MFLNGNLIKKNYKKQNKKIFKVYWINFFIEKYYDFLKIFFFF